VAVCLLTNGFIGAAYMRIKNNLRYVWLRCGYAGVKRIPKSDDKNGFKQ
jgi:hypothetical protein